METFENESVSVDFEIDAKLPPEENNKPKEKKDEYFVDWEDDFINSINIDLQGQLPKDKGRMIGIQQDNLQYLTLFAFLNSFLLPNTTRISSFP